MRRMLALVCTVCCLATVQAADWPQWRGPHFNGSTTETGLPTEWSRTSNVAWAADLPGASAATPIVSGDRVFVSSTDADEETSNALCFDRKTGKLLWSSALVNGVRRDSRSNYASPSPAANGKVVVFFFGTGDLIAFNYDGVKQWSRNIQEDYGDFAFLWTFSSSPVFYDGKLFLQVLQRNTPVDGRGKQGAKSYLLAINPENGKTLWRSVRPSQARVESLESFATPVPFEHAGRKELLVAGGDDITGHDLETGKELWRWGTWNPKRITHWRLVPSPAIGEDTILVCAPKRSPIYAIPAGGEGRLDDSRLRWVSRGNSEASRAISSDVPTPAFYDGDFFVLSDVRRRLSRVDPHSGKIKWSVATPGSAKYEASPLAADGKLYLINFIGDVVIFDAKDGKQINKISMDEPADDAVRSSVIAAGGQLFIRTNRKLYCIGK